MKRKNILKRTRGNPNGHTLMEIMVVMIVVGVIAAIVLPNYILVAESTKKAEAFHVLETLRSGQMAYKTNHALYATDINELEVSSFPVLKNFTNIQVFASNAGGTLPVASIDRITGSGYDYTPRVYVNGTFDCINESPAGICARLGIY